MPRHETITCDHCSRDITSTGNCEDYRIALLNQHIPSVGGWVTAMAAYPHLKQNSYFCSADCLKKWVEKNL